MRLHFRWYKRDSMEANLLGQRLARLWQVHQKDILRAFQEETGLTFTQREIAVRMIDGESASGWYRKPMRISSWYTEDDELLSTLTHELAHRLLTGHDMWRNYPSRSQEVTMAHKHAYLFLYDVWVNAFGEAKAQKFAKIEHDTTKESYHQAWDWAMDKSYEERKQALEGVKKIKHPAAS